MLTAALSRLIRQHQPTPDRIESDLWSHLVETNLVPRTRLIDRAEAIADMLEDGANQFTVRFIELLASADPARLEEVECDFYLWLLTDPVWGAPAAGTHWTSSVCREIAELVRSHRAGLVEITWRHVDEFRAEFEVVSHTQPLRRVRGNAVEWLATSLLNALAGEEGNEPLDYAIHREDGSSTSPVPAAADKLLRLLDAAGVPRN